MKLRKLKMDEVEIHLCAVLVGQGYFAALRGGSEKTSLATVSHIYDTEVVERKESVVHAYEASLGRKDEGNNVDSNVPHSLESGEGGSDKGWYGGSQSDGSKNLVVGSDDLRDMESFPELSVPGDIDRK